MAFDILSGFHVGQQLAGGPNPVGVAIGGILDRVNQIQQARLQAQTAGLTEVERLKALAGFYQSPEGTQLRNNILGGFGEDGTQVPPAAISGTTPSGTTPSTVTSVLNSQQPSEPSSLSDLGGYQPSYHYMKEITTDPVTGFPKTTSRQQETPQSRIRGAAAEDILKKQQEKEFSTQIVQQQLNVIKDSLSRITPVSAKTPGAPFLATAKGLIGKVQGTTSPEFAEVFATLSSAVPKLINAVGGIPGSRLNPNELKLMGALIMELPYLTDTEQSRRLIKINAMLGKAGVPGRLSQQPLSSPFQSVGQQGSRELPQGFRRR